MAPLTDQQLHHVALTLASAPPVSQSFLGALFAGAGFWATMAWIFSHRDEFLKLVGDLQTRHFAAVVQDAVAMIAEWQAAQATAAPQAGSA